MIQLGLITCPSGRLLIADAGYLGLWSGQEQPGADEAVLAQISDPQVREGVIAAADLEIVGPDAELAARSFNRPAGRWLYDIPAHGMAQVQQDFSAHCARHGFGAHLQPAPRRVPHRERAGRAASEGWGEFLMHGIPVVAVGDLPAGRMFPVTVTLKDFGGRVGVQWEVVTVHVRLRHLLAQAVRYSQKISPWILAWRLPDIGADSIGRHAHRSASARLALRRPRQASP